MNIIKNQPFELSNEHVELLKKTVAYENASLSPNTLRTYKSMFKKFSSWCEINAQPFLPTSAETISLYLSSIGETVSFSTIDITLSAIECVHEKANLSILGDKTLYRRVRKGIRRTHKENQIIRQATAMTILDLKVVCCRLSDNLKGCRDKALLTLTFFGAFRRSEVVSLNIENIQFNDKGFSISLLQCKTSDTKQTIYIAYTKDKDICPVKALKIWIEKSQIVDGAIFRSLIKGGKISNRLSGHAVSEIIKLHFGKEYSGHSPRRGLVTASAEKGTSIHIIKKHSRHKSIDMVLSYIEDSKGFEDSSVTMLGV